VKSLESTIHLIDFLLSLIVSSTDNHFNRSGRGEKSAGMP
jgi:hypothetical protein